jgi:hypothetical protein
MTPLSCWPKGNEKNAMSAESQHGNRSLARGHEERDVSFRPIVIASVILVVTILGCVAAMRVLFVYYLNREAPEPSREPAGCGIWRALAASHG